MTKEKIIEVLFIGIMTAFFAFVGWINKRILSKEYNEILTRKDLLQGTTHSLTNSLIGVVTFGALQQFYPEWSTFLQGGLSILSGSIVGDSIIIMLEKKIKNV